MLALLLTAAAFAAPVQYEDVDLKELLIQSKFALVVKMSAPPWSTTEMLVNDSKPQCGTYPVASYHFTISEVLKGRSSTMPTGTIQAAGAQAATMLAGARTYCDTGVSPQPQALRYMYGLTGVRQNQEIIVFLSQDDELGYTLTAQNAFEPASSSKKVRKWALKGY